MEAKDILKYGAVAAGVYFLWPTIQSLGQSVAPSIFGTPTPTPVAASTPIVATTGPAPVPAGVTQQTAQPTVADIKSVIAQLSATDSFKVNGLMSVSHWNFYYQQARGIPGPDPGQLFPEGDKSVTLDEYWAAMVGKGFQGFGGYGTTWRR
jgi:hypothetical protein